MPQLHIPLICYISLGFTTNTTVAIYLHNSQNKSAQCFASENRSGSFPMGVRSQLCTSLLPGLCAVLPKTWLLIISCFTLSLTMADLSCHLSLKLPTDYLNNLWQDQTWMPWSRQCNFLYLTCPRISTWPTKVAYAYIFVPI